MNYFPVIRCNTKDQFEYNSISSCLTECNHFIAVARDGYYSGATQAHIGRNSGAGPMQIHACDHVACQLTSAALLQTRAVLTDLVKTHVI
jgi:hypothetical protein